MAKKGSKAGGLNKESKAKIAKGKRKGSLAVDSESTIPSPTSSVDLTEKKPPLGNRRRTFKALAGAMRFAVSMQMQHTQSRPGESTSATTVKPQTRASVLAYNRLKKWFDPASESNTRIVLPPINIQTTQSNEAFTPPPRPPWGGFGTPRLVGASGGTSPVMGASRTMPVFGGFTSIIHSGHKPGPMFPPPGPSGGISRVLTPRATSAVSRVVTPQIPTGQQQQYDERTATTTLTPLTTRSPLLTGAGGLRSMYALSPWDDNLVGPLSRKLRGASGRTTPLNGMLAMPEREGVTIEPSGTSVKVSPLSVSGPPLTPAIGQQNSLMPNSKNVSKRNLKSRDKEQSKHHQPTKGNAKGEGATYHFIYSEAVTRALKKLYGLPFLESPPLSPVPGSGTSPKIEVLLYNLENIYKEYEHDMEANPRLYENKSRWERVGSKDVEVMLPPAGRMSGVGGKQSSSSRRTASVAKLPNLEGVKVTSSGNLVTSQQDSRTELPVISAKVT